jgi:hypothetical protein
MAYIFFDIDVALAAVIVLKVAQHIRIHRTIRRRLRQAVRP